MTVYSVFGQAGGASLVADTSDYTMGMQFSLSSDAALTGIWFYSAPGATVLPTACCIYAVSGQTQVAGTVNNAATWSGAPGSGWVRCAYDGSVTLNASTNYRVCVFSAGGSDFYSATSGYWSSGAGASGITSGIITAPAAASADGANQDAFVNPAVALTYPASSFGSANYWIDVEVTAGPVPLTGTDTGSGTEGASAIGLTGPDAGTGADTGTVTAALAGTDAGTGAEATAIGTAGADTGAGAESGTAAASLSTADTGAGADSAAVGIAGSDAGAEADAGSVSAAVAGADTGPGADAGSITAVVPGADGGTGTDTESVRKPGQGAALRAGLLAGTASAGIYAGTASNANTYAGSAS